MTRRDREPIKSDGIGSNILEVTCRKEGLGEGEFSTELLKGCSVPAAAVIADFMNVVPYPLSVFAQLYIVPFF